MPTTDGTTQVRSVEQGIHPVTQALLMTARGTG